MSLAELREDALTLASMTRKRRKLARDHGYSIAGTHSFYPLPPIGASIMSTVIVYAVVDDSLSPTSPLGVSLDVFVRREDAERFIEVGQAGRP
jgi:hypothetical protein